MGRYAQARKRGSDRAGTHPVPALPEVPLTVPGPSALDWTGYAGPTPDHWNIFLDTVQFDTTAGADMSYDVGGDHGVWTVQGVTSIGVATTQLSNPVNA